MYIIIGETLDGESFRFNFKTLQDARDYAKRLRQKGETGAGWIDGSEARSIIIKNVTTNRMSDRWDLMTQYQKHRG